MFGEDGALDLGRFTSSTRELLERLPLEAQLLGDPSLEVVHLLLALLRADDGPASRLLRRLGYEPAGLGERLRRALFRGRAAAHPPTLARAGCSAAMQRLLEQADAAAQPAGGTQVDERVLLGAVLDSDDPRLRRVLAEQGLDLDALRREAHAPQGQRATAGDGAAEARDHPPDAGPVPPQEVPLADRGLQVLGLALAEASAQGYEQILTPHLVLGLVGLEGGWTTRLLRVLGQPPEPVVGILRAFPAAGPARAVPPLGADVLSPRLLQLMHLAAVVASAEAAAIDDRHLLIGFLKVEGSATAQRLRAAGVDLEALLRLATSATADGQTLLLDSLGRDLTAEARAQRLRPLVGRRRELARVAQALARADKNAPLLIGEAGVGKTAIVEGLARRIADGTAPAHLQGARLIEVPIGSLVAGTRLRGDLEQRLDQVLREARRPEIILFLDEIHTLVGAGETIGGTLGVANMLKPALARGDIRLIGATTPAEFQRSIARDAALERRFQPIRVEEPTADETLEMLQQTRARYEQHHGVRLAEAALEAAVRLAVRYLPDRRLPDKAVDLIDEACVRAKVGSLSQWPGRADADGQAPVTIDAEAVARVVADWTGVPAARLTAADQQQLLELEAVLGRRVVGQPEAVAAVASAVRLARAGLRPPGRPTGTFLFVGPSGVGKTELAKALAEALFGTERALVRLDMSEYGEPYTTSRLIGAAPGLVGHGEEGQLTGPLHRQPYTVVLLDEIEKAHPRVCDLFLQLFDEGRLTDAQGRLVDGRNAIFIMTSNLLAASPAGQRPLGFGPPPAGSVPEVQRRQALVASLKSYFRPELLNRLDDIVVFRPLEVAGIEAVARLHLGRLAERLADQHGLSLVVEPGAVERLCRLSQSDERGARGLEASIERLVARPISQLVLGGGVAAAQHELAAAGLRLRRSGDRIVVEAEAA